jgi:hypothetical protein
VIPEEIEKVLFHGRPPFDAKKIWHIMGLGFGAALLFSPEEYLAKRKGPTSFFISSPAIWRSFIE